MKGRLFMKKNKRKIIILIGVLVLFIVLFIIIVNKKKDYIEKIDLGGVSSNYQIDDEMVTFLYERYHPENGLLFSLIGSNSQVKDYYGYYYKEDKTDFDKFPDILRNFILLNTITYNEGGYDEERRCYLYSLEEFRDLYHKNFGNLDQFKVEVYDNIVPHIYLNESSICITDEVSSNYTKVVDTYLVNADYQDDRIIIYERVSFLLLTDKDIEFYSDYKMEKKVYSLNKEDIDLSFVNNSKIVSNVLLKYEDEFPIYEYTYIKGEDTYYLESIRHE